MKTRIQAAFNSIHMTDAKIRFLYNGQPVKVLRLKAGYPISEMATTIYTDGWVEVEVNIPGEEDE
jgi:hypothetical protein